MSARDVNTVRGETMRENAEIVRRGYEAFNTADIETLTELFDENASWHTPGRGSDRRRPRGPRGGLRLVRPAMGGETGGTFKAELQHVLADDDGRVVGVHHNTAERNGKRLDVGCCIVFEIKDGRVIDGREHFYDLYAWDEFWS